MFGMLKLFGFAVVIVLATIFIAPAFLGDSSELIEKKPLTFKMSVPEKPATTTRQPVAHQRDVSLSQLREIAEIHPGAREALNSKLLEELADQKPADLFRAIKESSKNEVSEQTRELVTLAVEKAQEMIREDGLFVKPGHTKAQEPYYERSN